MAIAHPQLRYIGSTEAARFLDITGNTALVNKLAALFPEAPISPTQIPRPVDSSTVQSTLPATASQTARGTTCHDGLPSWPWDRSGSSHPKPTRNAYLHKTRMTRSACQLKRNYD